MSGPGTALAAPGAERWERREVLALLGVASVWMAAAGLLVGALNFFRCPDSYFHAAVAAKLLSHGLVLREFPWATQSVWAAGYFDKEWLFHVLLAGCVTVAGTLGGAKLLVLVLNGLVAAAWWWLFRALGIARRGWWLVALPFCTYGLFWERLLDCRPHLLSLVLLGLALTLMFQRRAGWLGLVSAVYALSYTGHWQLVGLVAVYDVLQWCLTPDGRRRRGGPWPLPLLLPVLLGLVAGELAHPNFPANVRGLWLQNIMVIKEYWQGNGGALWAMRPAEMRPLAGWEFALGLAPVLLGLGGVLAATVCRRRRLDRDVWVFAIYAAGYLVMTLKSQRFIEYLVPAAVTLVALYWTRCRGEWPWPGWLTRALGLLLVLYALAGHGLNLGARVAQETVRLGNRPHYAAAAQLLKERLPAGAIVFTQSWSDAPALFFGAPELRYLVFLDPFFMYAHDRERFDAWSRIKGGDSPDPCREIVARFQAQAVFIRGSPDPRTGQPVEYRLEAQLRQALGEPALRSAAGDVVFLLPAAGATPTVSGGAGR